LGSEAIKLSDGAHLNQMLSQATRTHILARRLSGRRFYMRCYASVHELDSGLRQNDELEIFFALLADC
jgi:hypothetical protein